MPEAMKIFDKKVKADTFEKIILVLMILFGLVALAIFARTLNMDNVLPELAIIEILIILIISFFVQTVMIIKIYEMVRRIEETQGRKKK